MRETGTYVSYTHEVWGEQVDKTKSSPTASFSNAVH